MPTSYTTSRDLTAFSGDATRFGDCYADDATAMTPDAGELRGRDEIINWMQQFMEAMPDARWEPLAKCSCS